MFKVGDIVRLRNGTAPQEVMEISVLRYEIRCEYLENRTAGYSGKWRTVEDFVYYEICEEMSDNKGDESMSDKLYKVTKGDETIYAKFLAIDSDGNWVMEGKSGEGVFSTPKDSAEEVLPYTVAVQFLGGDVHYHYKVAKGEVALGDVLWIDQKSSPSAAYNNGLVIVTDLDTKSKKATQDLVVKAKFLLDKS